MLSFSYLRANTKLTFFGLLYLNFSFLGSNISWIQKVQKFLRFRGIYFSRNIFFSFCQKRVSFVGILLWGSAVGLWGVSRTLANIQDGEICNIVAKLFIPYVWGGPRYASSFWHMSWEFFSQWRNYVNT